MYTWWFPESSVQNYGGDMFSADDSFQPDVDDTDMTGD
jgi:hypothetical protein